MASKNKLFKGAVIGAVGVGLLAGGFGTFALWSDFEALPQDDVTTGKLTLGTVAGTWTDESPDAADTVWDPAVDFLVPGDVVSVAIPFSVEASGKNLAGALTVDYGTFDLSAFATYLAVAEEIVITDAPVAGVTVTGDTVDFLRSAMPADTFTGTYTLTFTLDEATPALTAQNVTQALDQAQLVVTQARP